MRRPTRSLVAIPLALALAGCDAFGPPDACSLELRPGIVVEIRDAATNAFIAQQATAIVTEGSFRDSLRLHGSTRVGDSVVRTTKSGVSERAGTYTLEITAPGYARWVRTGIQVREDECHVRTANLVARLQPTAP